MRCDRCFLLCPSSSCVVTVGQRMFLRDVRKGSFYVARTDASWTLCKLHTDIYTDREEEERPTDVWMCISTLFIEIYSESFDYRKKVKFTLNTFMYSAKSMPKSETRVCSLDGSLSKIFKRNAFFCSYNLLRALTLFHLYE